MKKILRFVPLFLVTFSASFNADAKMSAEWEEKRANYKDIGKASCNDAKSFNKLKAQADNGDEMAAYWVYYTMASENCKLYSRDFKATHKYRLQTLNSGYPVAYRFVGKDYLYGYGGLRANAQKGLGLLKKSLELGHEHSAAELAYVYGGGRGTARDPELAMKYYKIAVEAGINEDTLKVVKKYFSNDLKKAATKIERTVAAGISEQSTNASTNNASSASDESEQFAALAVSMGDGGFGFAHDYPNAKSARERALTECRSRGGADCDIKMIGRGKGCMAYHSAGGSATAHGWAIGPTRNASETRAAQECRKRNGKAQCGNTSWVCNDRTKSKLEVVLNKPLPPTTTATSQCLVLANLSCKAFVPGKARNTQITGASGQMYSIENCGEKGREALGWSVTNNNWKFTDDKSNIYAGAGFSAEERAYFKSVLVDFKKTAISKFRGCTAPSFASIRFFKSFDYYEIYARPDYSRKILPYTVP